MKVNIILRKVRLSILCLLVPLIAQAQVKPVVRPYRVEKKLANVVNLESFKKAVEYRTKREFSLSNEQKEKLLQNGFVVTPSDAEQFFHVYETQHFEGKPQIPNFITSDCILQLYHLFYDFILRRIEVEKLFPTLIKLTSAMLDESKKQYEKVNDPMLKTACLKNISFFGVATKLLGIENISFPEDCISEIESELRKIEKHEGREKSSLFPWDEDYSQYIPRGHYDRNDSLKKFFLVMMWYGRSSFPFEFGGENRRQQILQALLMTHILLNSKIEKEPLINLWGKIYSITALYVGSTDDLNVHDLHKLMKEVYGEEIALEALADKEKLDLLWDKRKELRLPKIVGQAIGMPVELQFRFMGQRFIPDSYIMQKLVNWPERPWPKGLDVMAVLGSNRAEIILDEIYREPEKWESYLPRRDTLKIEFAELGEKDWYKNLFWGWLYTLKALLEERGEGYPSFMQNTAWTDKELNTSLASWAELRHDAILYAKPIIAEGGNGPISPLPKGYVEPVPEFYRRLLKLVKLNKQILLDEGIFDEKEHLSILINEAFNRYESLLSFLKDVSEKELMNESLSDAEYERIKCFGGLIEGLSIDLVWIGTGIQPAGWWDVEGPDKDIACIADIHTTLNECLEEAVGHINLIYVIVPIEGKLHLTRGGAFSYYEFKQPIAHRLTDTAWQEMLKRGVAPEPPSWTSSFIAK